MPFKTEISSRSDKLSLCAVIRLETIQKSKANNSGKRVCFLRCGKRALIGMQMYGDSGKITIKTFDEIWYYFDKKGFFTKSKWEPEFACILEA
jgi:hypothetical protein